MNWRNDPRIQRLLEKATLESLMKCYFQRVYGKKEVAEMEKALKNALNSYDNKEALYEKILENDENSSEPLIDECLDKLCESLHPGKSHTAGTLLVLARFFIKLGDFRLASEVIWCSASLAVQEFIRERKLDVHIHSHTGKKSFVLALSPHLGRRFAVFETCHSSFYTNSNKKRHVSFAMDEADHFIQELQAYVLTEKKKAELEKKNFNE